MSNFQDTDRQISDVIDFLSDGAKHEIEVIDESTGKPVRKTIIDSKSVKYQTRNISSNHFASFVHCLEEFGDLAQDAFNHMSAERANTLGNQILRKLKSFGYMIDAKSSEIVQNKDNNQKNLLAILTKNEVHKKYTVEGQTKGNVLTGLGLRKETDE